MKHFLLLALTTLSFGFEFGALGAPSRSLDAKIGTIVRAAQSTPGTGVAVAIVKNGEVVLMKGSCG